MADPLSNNDEYPESEAKELFYKKRLRLIIVLLYFLGLRVDELVSQTWSAFQKDREGLWWFYLIGKGSKPRILPVPDELLREIIRYRHFLNQTPLPAAQESGFIITDVTHVKLTCPVF